MVRAIAMVCLMGQPESVNAAEIARNAICKIATQFLPHAQLVLFGSRARGDARSRSDFDLAVFPRQGFCDVELLRFSEALENSSQIIYPIDVVDTRIASRQMLDAIQQEGLVWKG